MLFGAQHPGPEAVRLSGRPAFLARVAASAAAALLGALALLAGPAAAHNGRTVLDGDFGPYGVTVAAEYRHDGGVRGIALDVFVRTLAGRPVDGAAVTVTARADGEDVGPLQADRFGNTHRVVVPDAGTSAWAITITIAGPPGDATATGTVPGAAVLRADAGGHAEPETAGSAWPWLVPIAALAAAVGAASLTTRWRPVLRTASAALLAAGVVALAGSWADAPSAMPTRLLAVVPTLAAGGLLVAGLALLDRRPADAPALLFTGSAGLAVLFGWANRDVLAAPEAYSALPPLAARLTVLAAAGLGVGVMLLALGLGLIRNDLNAAGRVSPSPASPAGRAARHRGGRALFADDRERDVG